MSQENVELARRGYRHFNEVGELDSEFISPECEFDLSDAMPDVPPFKGLDRANGVLHDWATSFDDFRIEADRFLDAGSDRLVAFVRNTAQLKGSARRVENRFVHVWTIRGGKAIRQEGYLDENRDKALRAAGLRHEDVH
jgi:ketosteroid isomerase-like protein